MPRDIPVRRPRVARVVRRTATAPIAIGMLVFGTAVFAKMVDARSDRELAELALPPLRMTAAAAPMPMVAARPVIASTAAAPRAGAALLTASEPFSASSPRQQLVYNTGVSRAPSGLDRFSGAALVLDLFTGRPSRAALAQNEGPSDPGAGSAPDDRPDPTGDAIAAANAALPQASAGTGNERFAQRIGSKTADVSEAEQMTNLHRLVPQGAIVGAVMETALNSDLPGYARALVTKDVLSFDGSSVLIPAGSRVVGEYNSGVAQGASRVFIVWSRLIRPDGVSISLGSPAVDELGRGGLGGKVNRHFLQRFGGAILLSVLTGGINAAAASVGRGSTVVVNSAGEATSLISQAARGTDIAPTIKTKQGALVRIFVARDLDFTKVGPARP